MVPKRAFRITFPFIAIIAIYFLGPQPSAPLFDTKLPIVPSGASMLEDYVKAKEGGHKIKKGNEAEIVWADSLKRKTKYAVLYLHGFSASKEEGEPVHRRFADEFGCNLYLPRLADHGIDTTEALLLFTVDRFWESAKEALAIAKQLGDKVIVIGTSTGSTIGLKLASEYPNDIYALVHLSPNIAINNEAAFLLNNPWGLYIARAVMGGKYKVSKNDSLNHNRYWNTKYRLEAAVQLQELIEQAMTKETFSKVKQPSLLLYYYKNEKEQDPEVKVEAMLEMYEHLGTIPALKEAVPIPGAGAHVIGSKHTSNDINSVYKAMQNFAIQKLEMRIVNSAIR